MKILMVSSEASPFAKTGGLADAVSALCKALSSLGHEVRLVIPRYYRIDRKKLGLYKKSVLVNTGFKDEITDFYVSSFSESSAKIFFTDCEKFYGREGIYGSPFETDYHDNPYRFNLLCRSALTLCQNDGWKPEIIHCHDWAASLLPVILKFSSETYSNFFENTKTVLTIHNLGYQGRYPGSAWPLLGLNENIKIRSGLDSCGGINLLKGGISSADQITTVSENYAREIQNPYAGFGLDGLLRVRRTELTGILNGCDTSDWNPLTDKLIPYRYSHSDLTGKEKCKDALQKKFGLERNLKVPVIGIVNRFADQKGINELFGPMYGSMYRMCHELNVQFVVVGSGESWCEREVRNLSKSCKNMGSFIGFNESVSHLVEAGSDFFLMPSKYEPCGLNQIYSMIYGTIPVVRFTGGLADTVQSWNEEKQEGTGITFYDLTPDAIYGTVKYACNLWENNQNAIKKMQASGMKKIFSWKDAALKYLEVYKR